MTNIYDCLQRNPNQFVYYSLPKTMAELVIYPSCVNDQ